MAGIRRREAERNGLLFQADCGAGVDAVEDGIAEGEDLRCSGAAAVDDGEDVPGGEAGAAERETLVEAGELDQPGGGELDQFVGGCNPGARRELGDLVDTAAGDDGEA